jgi:hypothetical protein
MSKVPKGKLAKKAIDAAIASHLEQGRGSFTCSKREATADGWLALAAPEKDEMPSYRVWGKGGWGRQGGRVKSPRARVWGKGEGEG